MVPPTAAAINQAYALTALTRRADPIQNSKPIEDTYQADTVEVSAAGARLGMMSSIPDVRQDKIDAARRAIAEGEYDSDGYVNAVLDRLAADLL